LDFTPRSLIRDPEPWRQARPVSGSGVQELPAA
jgi:hypothetical protein